MGSAPPALASQSATALADQRPRSNKCRKPLAFRRAPKVTESVAHARSTPRIAPEGKRWKGNRGGRWVAASNSAMQEREITRFGDAFPSRDTRAIGRRDPQFEINAGRGFIAHALPPGPCWSERLATTFRVAAPASAFDRRYWVTIVFSAAARDVLAAPTAGTVGPWCP